MQYKNIHVISTLKNKFGIHNLQINYTKIAAVTILNLECELQSVITLGMLLNKGLVRNSEIDTFIEACLKDENELLSEEARAIGK